MENIKITITERSDTYGNSYLINGKRYNESYINLIGVKVNDLNLRPDCVKPFTQPWQDDDSYVEAVCPDDLNMIVFIKIDAIKDQLNQLGYKLANRSMGLGHSWWMPIKKE